MHITQADYISLEGHPFLRLIIDGKEALIGEFKWGILKRGAVPLHSQSPGVEWDKLLPEIYLPATEKEAALDLKGFTNDPVILKMAHSYWNAVNHLNEETFKIGPVLIP